MSVVLYDVPLEQARLRIVKCRGCRGGAICWSGNDKIDRCLEVVLRRTPWHVVALAALSYLAALALFISGLTLAFVDGDNSNNNNHHHHHHHHHSDDHDGDTTDNNSASPQAWLWLVGVTFYFAALWLVDCSANWHRMDIYVRNAMWLGGVVNVASAAGGVLGFVALAAWQLSTVQVMTVACTSQLINLVCLVMLSIRLAAEYDSAGRARSALAMVPGWFGVQRKLSMW